MSDYVTTHFFRLPHSRVVIPGLQPMDVPQPAVADLRTSAVISIGPGPDGTFVGVTGGQVYFTALSRDEVRQLIDDAYATEMRLYAAKEKERLAGTIRAATTATVSAQKKLMRDDEDKWS